MSEEKILVCQATAGFEEKNDLLVTVVPGEKGSGVQVSLASPVLLHFGKHIKQLVVDTVQMAGYKDVALQIKDKGAWDYTIKARILAALERGMKND